MDPVFIVPETADDAIALLELGLLYFNNSNAVPRKPDRWVLATTKDKGLTVQIRRCYNEKHVPMDYSWHYTDFAYKLED